MREIDYSTTRILETMALKQCEFEEGEYRAPLFNQLQTSNLLWEPGQVFEQYIGIDHALLTTNKFIHSIHGHKAALNGVVLSRYKLDFIWKKRTNRKKLPSFRLNVFIQAKRPQYGKNPPLKLRNKGLKSPYWRFEITPHQQKALENLHSKLKDRAIICYASPVFHEEKSLYKWTVEPKIVEHSTFPDVIELQNHKAWNYSKAGAGGYANPDPIAVDRPPLLERINRLVAQNEGSESDPVENLISLAQAVDSAMEINNDQATLLHAQYADAVREVTQIAEDLSSEHTRKSVIAFSKVILFSQIYRLKWLVAGREL